MNVGREDGKCAKSWDEKKSATSEMETKECGGKMLGFDCRLSETEKQCARGMQPEGI